MYTTKCSASAFFKKNVLNRVEDLAFVFLWQTYSSCGHSRVFNSQVLDLNPVRVIGGVMMSIPLIVFVSALAYAGILYVLLSKNQRNQVYYESACMDLKLVNIFFCGKYIVVTYYICRHTVCMCV